MKLRMLWFPDPQCPFQPDGYWPGSGPAPYGTREVGLWTFIAVVCSLFALFGAAYLMRISYEDWRLLPPVPWQLWLSTALLAAGDGAWLLAARIAGRTGKYGANVAANPAANPAGNSAANAAANEAAKRADAWPEARADARADAHLAKPAAAPLAARVGWLAWALSAAFVASQMWAWDAMAAQRVVVTAGPAASFFYMLTGLHAIHVIGGMVAGAWVVARSGRKAGAPLREGLALCARYWHALLALWFAVFGLLFWMTPELVRDLCVSLGIPVR